MEKVADLTSCYAKSVASDEDNDLHQNDVENFLRQHVTSNKAGAKVSYGISKYIPPNQQPDNYEGIDTLFDEQWMLNNTILCSSNITELIYMYNIIVMSWISAE